MIAEKRKLFVSFLSFLFFSSLLFFSLFSFSSFLMMGVMTTLCM